MASGDTDYFPRDKHSMFNNIFHWTFPLFTKWWRTNYYCRMGIGNLEFAQMLLSRHRRNQMSPNQLQWLNWMCCHMMVVIQQTLFRRRRHIRMKELIGLQSLHRHIRWSIQYQLPITILTGDVFSIECEFTCCVNVWLLWGRSSCSHHLHKKEAHRKSSDVQE